MQPVTKAAQVQATRYQSSASKSIQIPKEHKQRQPVTEAVQSQTNGFCDLDWSHRCATSSVAPPYHGGPHAIRCQQEWCMLGACLFLPGWQEIIQFSNVLQQDVALNAQYEILKIHNVATKCGRAQLPRANTIQTVLILLPTFRKQGRAHEFR